MDEAPDASFVGEDGYTYQYDEGGALYYLSPDDGSWQLVDPSGEPGDSGAGWGDGYGDPVAVEAAAELMQEPDVWPAIALYDFSEKSDGYLNFLAGAEIAVYQVLESGWCEGELYDGSARGWFPNDAITFDVVGENVSGEQLDGATSEEHAAAITIQSYYRGTQARKASKKLREANAARTTPVKTATAEEHAAATKIQAGFRGLQARRKSAKLRSKPLVTHPQPPTIAPPKVIVSEDQQEMPSSQTGLTGADIEATAVQAEYESAVSSTDAVRLLARPECKRSPGHKVPR